jgi:hypothetical protein
VRQLIRTFLRRLVQVDIVFSAVLLLARFAEFCIRQKYAPSMATSGSIEKFIGSTFPDNQVRRGPFEGLRFPRNKLTPSLAPKLIGSYEREIAEVIEELCSEEWSAIVDIGCAEGYYAVGLALRIPGAIVHAYDADPNMMRSCRETAELNGVESRIRIGSFLTSEALKKLDLGHRALIISDCEGHEYSIFTAEIIGNLKRHDVLIELHDGTRGALTSNLIRKFSLSHIPQIIRSIDDWRKPLLYEYPELAGVDVASRMKILAEARGDQMEWLYCRSRAISATIPKNSPVRASLSARDV